MSKKRLPSFFEAGNSIDTQKPISLSATQREQGLGLGADVAAKQHDGADNAVLLQQIVKQREEFKKQQDLAVSKEALDVSSMEIMKNAKKLEEAKKKRIELETKIPEFDEKTRQLKLAEVKKEEEDLNGKLLQTSSAALDNPFLKEQKNKVKSIENKAGIADTSVVPYTYNIVGALGPKAVYEDLAEKSYQDFELDYNRGNKLSAVGNLALSGIAKTAGLVRGVQDFINTFGAEVKNSFVDVDKYVDEKSKLPTNHKNYVNKDEYKSAKNTLKTVLRPIAQTHSKAIDNQLKIIDEAHKNRVRLDPTADNSFTSDKIKYTFLKNKLTRAKQHLEGYLNDDGGSDIWARELFGKTLVGTGDITLLEGMRNSQYEFWFENDVADNLQAKLEARAVKENKKLSQLSKESYLEVFNSLPKIDQEILKSNLLINTANAAIEDDLNWSYKAVRDTGHSIDFMASMYLGGRIVKGVSALGRAAVAGVRGSQMASTLTGLKAMQKATELATRTANAMGKTGLAIGSGVGETLMTGAATEYLNPKNLTGSNYSLYRPILKDKEKGYSPNNVLAVFGREGGYEIAKRDIESDKKIYQNLYSKLKDMPNLSGKDQDQLKRIGAKLGITETDFVTSDGEKVSETTFEEDLAEYEVKNKAAIHARGIVTSAVEVATEIYTGDLLKYIGGKVGVVKNSTFVKGLVEKIPGKNKFLASASGKIANIENYYSTSLLGRALTQADRTLASTMNVQGKRMFGGIGEEIAEEYVAALASSPIAFVSGDQDPNKEIKEAFGGLDFPMQVAFQTMLMKGMFGTIGAGSTLTKVGYHKAYKNSVAEADSRITALEERLKNNPEETDTKQALSDAKANKEKLQKRYEWKGAKATYNYLQSRKEMQKAVDDLRGVTEDHEVSVIIDALHPSTPAEEKLRKAAELRSTNIPENEVIAQKIEKSVDRQTLQKAVATGTDKELDIAITRIISSDNNLSVEQSQRLQEMQTVLKGIQEFRRRNQSNAFVEDALPFVFERLSIGENPLGPIAEERESIREEAERQFSSLLRSSFPTLTDVEAVKASFSAGTLEETHPEIYRKTMSSFADEKTVSFVLPQAAAYLNGYNLEESISNTLADLDMAILETLNPTPEIRAKSSFMKEYNKYYEALKRGDESVLEDLELTTLTFHPNNEIANINDPKVEEEILYKLSRKYVQAGKLNAEEMGKLQTRVKSDLDKLQQLRAIKEAKKAHALAMAKAMEKAAADNPDTSLEDEVKDNLPTAQGDINTTTIIDADAITTFTEIVNNTTFPEEVPPADTNNPPADVYDPTSEYTSASEDAFDLSIGETPNPLLEAHMSLLRMAYDHYRNWLPSQFEVSFEMLVTEIFKVGNPKIRILPLIAAWEKLGLPTITNVQVQWAIERFNKPDMEFLSSVETIFQSVVTVETVETEVKKDQEIIEQGQKNEGITVVPIALPPAEILGENLDPEKKEEQENLEAEINARAKALIEAGIAEEEEALEMARRALSQTGVGNPEADAPMTVTPFLGYLAVTYDVRTETNGNEVKVTSSNPVLNTGDIFINGEKAIKVEFQDLIHPDKYQSGAQFTPEVAPKEDWSRIITKSIDPETGTEILISYQDYVDQRLLQDPNYLSSEEFWDEVPMYIKDASGKRLAHIHNTSWFTTKSIPNPDKTDVESTQANPSVLWKEEVEAHKRGNRQLRDAVRNGLTTVTITKPLNGVPNTLPAGDPLISVNESNPQAKLIVQKNTGKVNFVTSLSKIDKGFKPGGNKILLNKEEEFERNSQGIHSIGHTWAIYRVGSQVINGKLYETYQAMKTYTSNTSHSQSLTADHLESVRWVLEAANRSSAYNNNYRLTQEQKKKIQEAILENMKIDITTAKGLMEYINSIMAASDIALKMTTPSKSGVPHSVSSYAPYIELLMKSNLTDEEILFGKGTTPALFRQNTHSDLLNNPKIRVIQVSQGNPSIMRNDAGEAITYTDFVGSVLKTNLKALNVSNEGEPAVYTIRLQPKIEVTFTANNIPEAKGTLEQVQEQAQKEVVDQAKKEEEQTPTPTEVKATVADLQATIDLLSSLQVSIDAFDNSDLMIGSLEELQSLFSLTENLSLSQERGFLQYIENSIIPKLGIKAKISKESLNKMKEEIRPEFVTWVESVSASLSAKLALLENSGIEDSRLTSTIAALKSTISSGESAIKDFDSLFSKSLQSVERNTKVEFAEEEKDTQEEDLEKEKNYSQESLEEKIKDKASARLKMMLYGVPALSYTLDPKTGKYISTPITGYFGVATTLSLDEVYNLVLKTLAANTDVLASFDSIMEKLSLSENPAVQEVVKRFSGLDPTFTVDEQLKHQFVNNVTAHSLSSKFLAYKSAKTGTQIQLYNTNSSEITYQIKETWLNNSAASSLYYNDGSFNKLEAQKLLKEYEELVVIFQESLKKDNKLSVDDIVNLESNLRSWLAKIGLTMHNRTWEKLYSGEGLYIKGNYQNFRELFDPKSAYTLYGRIADFLQKGINSKTEEEFSLDQDMNFLKDLNNISKALSDLEAQYNPELISLSFRDTGKNIFSMTPPKFFTDRITALVQEDSPLVEALLKTSYSSNSMILDLLASMGDTSEDIRNFLRVHHVSLSAIKDMGKNKAQGGIEELSSLDYDMFVFGAFADRRSVTFSSKNAMTENGIPLRVANMSAPTMSDKNQAILITAPVLDLLNTKHLDRIGEGVTMSKQLMDDLLHYLAAPEIKRIVNFHKNVKQTGITGYDMGAKLFHAIPALNTVQVPSGNTSINLVEYLASGVSFEDVMKDPVISTSIKDVLEKVVLSEVKRKTNEWTGTGLTTNEQGTVSNKLMDSKYFSEAGKDPVKDFDLAVYDFVINSLIFQGEVSKVFMGDIANFSQDKVWKKAIQQANKRDSRGEANSHTLLTLSPQDYVNANKVVGINLGKRLAYLIAPGKKIAESVDEQYYQIFLKDPVDIAENTVDLVELYYPLTAENKANLEEQVREYRSLMNSVSELQERNDLTPEEIYNKDIVYPNRIEEIRKELQEAYPMVADYFEIESADAQEYTTVGEHLNILYKMGRLTTEQYDRVKKTLANGQDLDYKDLEIVMQPIKPVHTGSYVSVKEGEEAGHDLARVVYIKSSSFPLLPQLTRGKKLDALRVAMEKLEGQTQKFVRASYQTANKVGSPKNTINPMDQISLDSISTFPSNANNNPESPLMLLDRNNFRIQQDVPFKSKKKKQDTVALGTQIFKLLFGDGVIVAGEGKAVFDWNNSKITGNALYQKYSEAFKGIIEYEKAKLFSELGLNSEGEIVDDATFMIKVKDMLQQEAIDRGYPIKEVRGLELTTLVNEFGREELEFTIPLWLSPSSNKYEALLNSIFTNRIMQFKIPGNGFIAGSEAGFKRTKKSLEELDSTTKDSIIYLPGWNGTELQGTKYVDGSIQKAQVMIASKFKDSTNTLIDLFEDFNETTGKGKYIKRNEKGNLELIEDMIDPQLFNLFSFRTPTSSHVSGSSIEIVGILPPASGDLMIVPKNFTKQKGLDFDIDKESAYGFNHYVDETGKIKLIDQEYLDKIASGDIRVRLMSGPDFDAKEYYKRRKQHFTDRRSELDKVKTARGAIRNLIHIENERRDLKFALSLAKNPLDLEYLNQEIDKLGEEEKYIKEVLESMYGKGNTKGMSRKEYEAKVAEVKEKFSSEMALLEDEYFANIGQEYLEEIQKKIHQNNFVKVHLAVYNTSDKGVQQKINKILSMSVAQGQAEKIAQWKEEGNSEDNTYFTMFNYSYQKSKLDLGSVGKMAIGVYAVATTFNGLLQTTFKGVPSQLGNGSFTIGNYTSSGIGAFKTLTKNPSYQRDIAEVFAEKENTATDNEKEQILARVGINSQTIGVDALMTLRGFDLGEEGNSIPYLLVSQPAVVEFNKKLKDAEGILGGYIDKVDLIATTVEKLSNGILTYVVDPITGKTYFEEKLPSGDKVVRDPGSSLLTEQALIDGVKKKDTPDASLIQAHALMVYLQLEEESGQLIPLMSSLNNNSLGKSVPEAVLKEERLSNAIFNTMFFKDYYKLFGEQVKSKGPGVFEFTKETPFGTMVKYIKPTTPQGILAMTGLKVGAKAFERLFIYNSAPVQEIVAEIFDAQGKDMEFATAEDYEKIMKEIKKYLYSNKDLFSTFESTPKKRTELFKDTATNTSLAKYLQEIIKTDGVKKTRGVQLLRNNTLFGKRLRYKVGKGENEISTILFNTAVSDSISEEELYSAIPELVLENLPLPDRNGRPYTTRDLAEDMVIYSFLEGGVQEATQFIKYVPIEMLSSMGHLDADGNFISISKMLQKYQSKINNRDYLVEVLGLKANVGISHATLQIFQNNPSLAKKVSLRKVEMNLPTGKMKIKKAKVVTPGGVSEEFTMPLLPFYYYLDSNKKEHLFRQVRAGEYVEVPINRVSKISQYTAGTASIVPIGTSEETEYWKALGSRAGHNFNYLPGMTITSALSQVLEMNVPKEMEYLKELAAFLIPSMSNTTGTVGNVNFGAKGKATGLNVFFGDAFLNSKNTTDTDIARTLIHEVLHTLSVSELNKYFAEDSLGNYNLKPEFENGVGLPKAVTDLIDVFKAFTSSGLIKPESVNKIRAAIKGPVENRSEALSNLLSNWNEETDGNLEITYAAMNIKEFVSILFENPDLRAKLNEVPYNKKMSILDKIAEVFNQLLEKFFHTENLDQSKLAAAALKASLNFMVEAKTIAPKELKSLPLNKRDTTNDIPDIPSTVFGVDDPGLPEGLNDDIEDTPPGFFGEDTDTPPSDLFGDENTGEGKGPTFDFGISEELWNSLTEQEKKKILECN